MSQRQRPPRNKPRAVALWRVGERYDCVADVPVTQLLEEAEQIRQQIVQERQQN